MGTKTKTKRFNRSDLFIAGWYWAMPAHQLRSGQVKPVTLLGKDLAIYRSPDGRVVAIDAYCPHMGAHLAEGQVESGGLRCFFHNWKFDACGHCIDSPALDRPSSVQLQTWLTAERYGLIWVWVGEKPAQPLPHIPELTERDCAYQVGKPFRKNCHPHVLLINAIDAHHFNTVHNLPLQIVFEKRELNAQAIEFHNITRGGDESRLLRLIRPLYQKEVTYRMCYWYGSTGTVTLGPDFLHFYIMFALRPSAGGKTEGHTILITPQRPHLSGWLLNRILLWLTQQVGNYFAKGDTQIFQTIKFDFKTPTSADRSIIQFIDHIEQQPVLAWETWQPVDIGAET